MSSKSARRPCAAVALAAVSACVAFALVQPARAGEFTVTKNADSVMDARGLTLDSSVALYGVGINGAAFESSAITTFNGWQYSAYWVRTGTTSTSNYVAVARRPVGTTAWQVANLTASVLSNGLGSNSRPSDAHNVVSLGIDETNGTLHLAYDLHGHNLKYRVSNVGVATNPGAITSAQWSQSLFQSQRNWLVNSSTPVTGVTYPHFIRQNNGGLQLTYRTGGSGNGSNFLADYNGATNSWGNVHQYDNGGTGTYFGTVTNGDNNRNSYINGITYGPSGRAYQSFTWREGATGAANHDINFVYSDDQGNTWKNNAGTTVGTGGTNGTRWNLNSPGLIAIPLNESQSLMNQQTQAVTSDDKFHTMMWHRDTAKPNTGGVYRPTESSYFDYWRDSAGGWHRNKLPGAVGSRPQIYFDADDNAFAIYQQGSFDASGIYIANGDLVIAAASKATNWTDWKVIKTEAGPFVSEAQADRRMLALNGILSVVMQQSPSATSPAAATNMRALDYAISLTPATDRTFQVASGNWGNIVNWSGNAIPSVNANAIINAGRTAIVNTAVGTLDGSLVVGAGGSAGTFNLQNTGSMTVTGSVIVGRDGGAVGTYVQNSGSINSWRFVVGDYFNEISSGGQSSATLTNASLTTGELLVSVGGASTSGSSFTMGGNSVVTVNGEVILGEGNNTAALNVNGGTLTVNGDIREGFNGNPTSAVTVSGGTLNATGNAVFADTVTVNGGTLANVASLKTLNGTGGAVTRTDSANMTLAINDGSFAGAIQNGNGVVALNKLTTGTLTLGGNSTYTGATTVNAGVLRAASNAALGATSGNTVVPGGTSTARLELAGNITTNEPIVLAGRQPDVATSNAPHIANFSGTNTLAGTIETNVGGNQYNVSSDGGKLIVTGTFINNGSGGFSDVRTLKLLGAADGEWRSTLSDNAGGTAKTAVAKLGAGTWTLAGNNTYTGVTTVSAGTLRATSSAYANLLNNAGGVDLNDGAASTLVLDYTAASPVGTVKTILDAGNLGTFATGQIRSTTLAAGHVIGYRDDGVSAVTVRVTLPGDADLDGDVDFNDFLALQTNFGDAGTRFDQGNFDFDGETDFNDFLALQTNFGQSLAGGAVAFTAEQVAAVTAFAATAAVPEPAALGLLGVLAVALGRRTRRVADAS